MKNGYKVYTNRKDLTEFPIAGTIAINIPLKYIIAVVRYCGSAISIRCGLTDLLAVGECDIEVVYVVQNEIDEYYAKMWRQKLGTDNILMSRCWITDNTDENFQKNILARIKAKYGRH